MNTATTLYGYNPELGSSTPVDYVHTYHSYLTGQPLQIPYPDSRVGRAEHICPIIPMQNMPTWTGI